MRLLLYECHTFTTSYTPEQILQYLEENTEPFQLIRINWPKRKIEHSYEASIGNKEFKMKRIINYQNSFLPIITGKLFETDSAKSTSIKLTISPTKRVLITGTILLCFLALFTLPTGDLNIFLLGLLFMYLLMLFGFKMESSRYKRDFTQLFKLANS